MVGALGERAVRPRARWLASLAATSVLLAPSWARAAASGQAVAETRSSASAVFAVIVTNNRSTRLDRPDLQYADDDGARYYQLVSRRGAGRPRPPALLTRFDPATASVHPELVPVAQPPRRAGKLLASRFAEARGAILEARRAGKHTEFYFVFAGHGDVEGGIGYLDLEDARIDPAFLEHEVVERVPRRSTLHVVLDQLQFVVRGQPAQTRRAARGEAAGPGARLRGAPSQRFGLFLSTNSEAEVYEWSELESGIFSHEVRSGLSGAADADGDGRVSYAELAGFVDRANAKLPSANLRPHVFLRGPNGDAGAVLFSPASSTGRRLTIGPGERRLWIRGAGNERLLDLHKEQAPMTIVVPGESDQPFTVAESRAPNGPTGRPALSEYDVPRGDVPVALAELPAQASLETARGGAAIFGALFQIPYGPQAFASFMAESDRGDEAVYGVGAADEARMRHYLTFIADSDREVSRTQGLMLGGLGAVFLGTGIATVAGTSRWDDNRAAGLIVAGLGLPMLAMGLEVGLSKSVGQRTLEMFQSELAQPGADRAAVVAHIESNLDQLARVERRKARFAAGWLGATALLAATVTTAGAIEGPQGRQAAPLVAGFGTAAVMGAMAWRVLDVEMPTERLLRLYRSDPDLDPQIGIGIVPPVPTAGGTTPALVSVSGRF